MYGHVIISRNGVSHASFGDWIQVRKQNAGPRIVLRQRVTDSEPGPRLHEPGGPVGNGMVRWIQDLPAQRPSMPSKSTPSQHGHVGVHGRDIAAQWLCDNAHRHQHAIRRPSHRVHGTRYWQMTTAKPTYHIISLVHQRSSHHQESIGTDGRETLSARSLGFWNDTERAACRLLNANAVGNERSNTVEHIISSQITRT